MKQCPYCYHILEAADLIDLHQAMPQGCVCDPREWFTQQVPPICARFAPMSDEEPEICGHCQHERGCHETAEKPNVSTDPDFSTT